MDILVQRPRIPHPVPRGRRFLTQVTHHRRFAEAGEHAVDAGGDTRVGVLGDQHHDLGARVYGQHGKTQLGHAAAHGGPQVAAAGADGVGDADPEGVEVAADLLDAGA